MEHLTFNDLPQAISQLCQKLDTIERLLVEQGKPESVEPHDELLTVKEAAKFLGISVPTLYSKKSRGEIPVCKPAGSKKLFFSKMELTEYIKSGKQKSNAEIEAEAQHYIDSTASKHSA